MSRNNDVKIYRIRWIDMCRIHRLVREIAELGQTNPDEDLTNSILEYTDEIVEIANKPRKQGENKMDNGKLTDKVFKHVSEAMEKAERGAMDGYAPGPTSFDIAHDTSVRIVEDVLSGKVSTQTDFIDQFYEMDPETEDVLDNGTLIVDGMKVLIEHYAARETIRSDMPPIAIHEARMKNRWCTVTESKIMPGSGNQMLSFIGVYEDGVKRKRTVNVNYAWIVKTDSIPRRDTILFDHGDEKFTGTIPKVLEILESMPKGALAQYNVKIGETDIVIPADQYVLAKGDMEAVEGDNYMYEVIAPHGDIVFTDKKAGVLTFLQDKSHTFLNGALVCRTDKKDGEDALAFLQDNKVTIGAQYDNTYSVVSAVKNGSPREVIFIGTKTEVVNYLIDMDSKKMGKCEVFYQTNKDDTVSALTFLTNQGKVG